MKKITKVLLVIMMFFITTAVVFAEADYTYRTKRDNRVKVKINNKDVYVAVNVLFDMEGDFSQEKKPVEKFDAKYKNGTLYVSIKRSEMNKLFKAKKYNNVYSIFEVTLDYLDIKSDKNYFWLKQNYVDSKPGEGYSFNKASEDYLFRNYNIIEVDNIGVGLQGLASNAQGSEGGGFQLFEIDGDLPDLKTFPEFYNLRDLNFDYQPIIKFDRSKAEVTIVEDVQMDLGETEKVISSERKTNKETGEQETIEIEKDNYYAEYIDKNKMAYSWTMYDKDGKPLKISVDTGIVMDKSENEEEIMSNFGTEFENIKDRVKIISFNHDGDLGGTAKISLYVGDKFEPGSVVTLLYYNPTTSELENPEFGIEMEEERYSVLVDKDGYIAIELTHCSEYAITEEEIAKKVLEEKKEEPKQEEPKEEKATKKDSKKLYLIAGIAGGVVLLIIILIIVLVIKKKKAKKANEELTQ